MLKGYELWTDIPYDGLDRGCQTLSHMILLYLPNCIYYMYYASYTQSAVVECSSNQEVVINYGRDMTTNVFVHEEICSGIDTLLKIQKYSTPDMYFDKNSWLISMNSLDRSA